MQIREMELNSSMIRPRWLWFYLLRLMIYGRFATNSKGYQMKFRFIRFRHDMYEFALLHAAQDSLRATQLLSNDANAYILTGECLAKLRKLKECVN
jgi:hypothetical protein